jgi:hypothetical protein
MVTSLKYLTVGATAFGVLVLAIIGLKSHASEHAASQLSFRSEQPAAFETNPIVGSNASNSTYGLDQAHPTDW